MREVVYRLEAGEDTTVSSLMAVLGALGLAIRLEPVGLPSADSGPLRYVRYRCALHFIGLDVTCINLFQFQAISLWVTA